MAAITACYTVDISIYSDMTNFCPIRPPVGTMLDLILEKGFVFLIMQQ